MPAASFRSAALAAVAGLFVFCGFTAALGVRISLRAKNSTRALFATIFCLLVVNGGYLILVPEPARESALVSAGVMPYMEWAALISYREASWFSWADWFAAPGSSTIPCVERLRAYVIAVLGYGLGTLVLSRSAVRGFNTAVDRPEARHGPGAKGASAARAH